MPSFYQSDLFRALVATGEVDLKVVFAKDLPEDRVNLGWKSDLGGFSYQFLDPNSPTVDALKIAKADRHRFHIVNGIWAERAFTAALNLFAVSGTRYAVYSEAPDPNQKRSWLKRTLQQTLGGVIVRQACGLLPVSHLATEFFRRLGAEESLNYPFGYFRHCSYMRAEEEKDDQNKQVNILFVGQIIHRKGPDILLEAMTPLFKQHSDLHLTFMGGGKLMSSIAHQVKSSGLMHRVTFTGVIPSSDIPSRLSGADALVLPSRWDGWGLVVNEALFAGVPAIVSDKCGAAEVIDHGRNGYVFHSENVNDLRTCLSSFMQRRNEWGALKGAAAALGESLSPVNAAKYLVQCVQHMSRDISERPVPPWI